VPPQGREMVWESWPERDKQRDRARRPHVKRRFKPVARVVWTVLVLWALGMGGAGASTLMIAAGYRIDALQARLVAMTRQEQALAGQVAAATSPEALAVDARTLHVAVAPVRVAPPPRFHLAQPVGPGGIFVARLQRLWHGFERWFRAVKLAERGSRP
jgi:hypothetical protein